MKFSLKEGDVLALMGAKLPANASKPGSYLRISLPDGVSPTTLPTSIFDGNGNSATVIQFGDPEPVPPTNVAVMVPLNVVQIEKLEFTKAENIDLVFDNLGGFWIPIKDN